jgi:DNA-binding transcriptional regulator YiaG
MRSVIDVKSIRDTLKLTQAQLAERVGVAQGDISNWETGKHAPSRAARATLERLLAEKEASAA